MCYVVILSSNRWRGEIDSLLSDTRCCFFNPGCLTLTAAPLVFLSEFRVLWLALLFHTLDNEVIWVRELLHYLWILEFYSYNNCHLPLIEGVQLVCNLFACNSSLSKIWILYEVTLYKIHTLDGRSSPWRKLRQVGCYDVAKFRLVTNNNRQLCINLQLSPVYNPEFSLLKINTGWVL